MKKMLLFALALGIGFSSFAQDQKQKKELNLKAFHKNVPRSFQIKAYEPITAPKLSLNGPVKPSAFKVKGPKAGLNQIQFASSYNILSVSDPSTRPLSAIPSLNLVAFTHRYGGIYGGPDGNRLRCTYTTNNGVSFDSINKTGGAGILNTNANIGNTRYPQGVILNPTGNTDPTQAYLAYCGPYVSGSSWAGDYICSERFDGDTSSTNFVQDTMGTAGEQAGASADNMVSCNGDQMVHSFNAFAALSGGGYTEQQPYVVVENGTLAGGDTIKWDTVHFAGPIFETFPSQSPAVNNWADGQAWSEDGNTGYIYFMGVDSITNYGGPCRPIVYKSTDKGATWAKLPTFDFSTLSNLADSVYPLDVDATKRIPNLYGLDYGQDIGSAVDKNGNLHLAMVVVGQLSLDPDSIVYSYNNEPEKLYHLIMTPTGTWTAQYITRMIAGSELSTDPNALIYTGSNIGWNHRVQLSRTYDETKMFATWTDNTDTVQSSKLIFPQIFGYGWDCTTGCTTPVKNFTTNTAYDGVNFWNYAADRVLTSGSTGSMTYNIPCTVTQPNSDGTATSPTVHFFMTGINFTDADFLTKPVITVVGGDTLTSSLSTGNQWYKNGSKISGATNQTYVITAGGNYYDIPSSCGTSSDTIKSSVGIEELSNNCYVMVYPNPFRGTTNISLSLTKGSNVSLSVIDMLGQNVYEMNYGVVDAGSHMYSLDGSKLQSGIYIINIKAGENTVTRKMIVE